MSDVILCASKEMESAVLKNKTWGKWTHILEDPKHYMKILPMIP